MITGVIKMMIKTKIKRPCTLTLMTRAAKLLANE